MWEGGMPSQGSGHPSFMLYIHSYKQNKWGAWVTNDDNVANSGNFLIKLYGDEKLISFIH